MVFFQRLSIELDKGDIPRGVWRIPERFALRGGEGNGLHHIGADWSHLFTNSSSLMPEDKSIGAGAGVNPIIFGISR